MRKVRRMPPVGAPEGTIWFGGPVDRFAISLRIYGDDLDPDQISGLLGCMPTDGERKGVPVSSEPNARIAKRGRWSLSLKSQDCAEDDDVEDGVRILLSRLPSDRDLWMTLTSRYQVDVFCGLFLKTDNRGFGISVEVSKLLSDRNLEIGFDVYFDRPQER